MNTRFRELYVASDPLEHGGTWYHVPDLLRPDRVHFIDLTPIHEDRVYLVSGCAVHLLELPFETLASAVETSAYDDYVIRNIGPLTADLRRHIVRRNYLALATAAHQYGAHAPIACLEDQTNAWRAFATVARNMRVIDFGADRQPIFHGGDLFAEPANLLGQTAREFMAGQDARALAAMPGPAGDILRTMHRSCAPRRAQMGPETEAWARFVGGAVGAEGRLTAAGEDIGEFFRINYAAWRRRRAESARGPGASTHAGPEEKL